MDEDAAAVVPVVLDYLYSLNEDRLDVTEENFVGLYKLADYLQIESLLSKLVEFWGSTMDAKVQGFGTHPELANDTEFGTYFELANDTLRSDALKKSSSKSAPSISITSTLMIKS